MKKIIGILVLAVVFTISNHAQKGKRGDFEKLTKEQQTELAVKKMTLKLDLTPAQQRQIKPLLAQRVTKRKALYAKRKARKEKGMKGEELSANERFEKQRKC